MLATPAVPPDVTIRPAQAEDAGALLALMREAAAETRPAARSLTAAQFEKDGFGPAPAFRAFVARGSESTVGYALCCRDYDTDRMVSSVYLAGLYVRPQSRRQGVGTALVAAAVRAGGEWNARLLTWMLPQSNAAGRSFGKRFGVEHPELLICTATGQQFAALADARETGQAIRRAEPRDAAAIAGMLAMLLEELREPMPNGIEPALRKDGFGRNPSLTCFVAPAAPGGLDGYAMFWPLYDPALGGRGMLLSDLYVRPRARRSGLASALLQRVAGASALQGGCFLFWQVLRHNEGARTLYRRIAVEEDSLVPCTCDGQSLQNLRRIGEQFSSAHG